LSRTRAPGGDLREQLVTLLADGEFHSGAQLGAQLGVSRTAVWKALGKLEELGAEIHAVPKRGYRFAQPVEVLALEAIGAALPAALRRRVRHLERFLAIDSTNTRLLERTDLAVGSTDVCVAELQTAGRGRRGRAWSTQFGGSICLSMSWLFPDVPRQLSALSLAIGVGVLRSLRACGAADVRLKWPNDVMLAGRKLGGILIELRAEFSGPAYVVVGVGLNYRLSAGARRALRAAGIEATDLHDATASLPGRNALVAMLVAEIAAVLEAFQRQGLRPFAAEWRDADALAASAANVSYGNETYRGIARGIDEDGALLLETPGKLLRFTSGEVSVRSAG
jgi:BirA family transcriptional regulator, biotin operon repressor / biotin---[acetyl-CoA-carboxylase] ligase